MFDTGQMGNWLLFIKKNPGLASYSKQIDHIIHFQTFTD